MNSFIIRYPQTKPHSYWPANPDACWDWWSYVNHSDDYVTKSGPQIKAIKAMLDALTGGAATPNATLVSESDQSVSAPQGLTANDASDSSVDLVWFPVSGATTYKVQREGADRAFQTVGEVAGASFGDSGLTPQTAFRWRVSAMLNGTEGPASEEVIATTRSRPPPCKRVSVTRCKMVSVSLPLTGDSHGYGFFT
ncbi:fibronectin type III domain-containing protein [Bradyrhizobium ottawaense]